MDFNPAYFWQILANGLHNGALYALLAYGYVLMLTVTQRTNLAHGAIFAFAGQILVLATSLAYHTLLFTFSGALGFGILSAAVITAIVVVVMAREVLPKFVGRSPNMTIVATLAIAIMLMEAARLAADGRDLWLAPVLQMRVELGLSDSAPSIAAVQLLNLCVIFTLLLGVELWLLRSMVGRSIRAVADDAGAAALGGVNARGIVVLTIGLASALAAVGGMLAVLYFGNMSFGSGLTYGLKVLFISAAGGFSRPLFAAAGAFVFGEAEAMWDGYLPIIWREPAFYSGLALILCLRGNSQVMVHKKIV